MAIRLSGLSSGLDTESIIKELMSAQSMKLTKIQNNKTKLEWKEEKWQELNKKIYALYTEELSKLKTQGSYLTKSATVSDESKAKVTASSKVPAGTHTIEIQSVASSQFVTGSDLSKNNNINVNNITNKSKLSELGINEGTTFTLVNKKTGAEGKTFTVTESTKISDLSDFAKEYGVNLTYDETNKRFFMSSIESGEENAFSLTSKAMSDETAEIGKKLKTATGYDHLSKKDQGVIDEALKTIREAEDNSDEYKNATRTLQNYAQAYDLTSKDDTAKESAEKFQEIFKQNLEQITGSAGNDGNTETVDSSTVISGISQFVLEYKTSLANSATSALDQMGLCDIEPTGVPENSGVSFVKASDCTIKYNGAIYDSNTNELSINGLKINAIEITDTPIKVTVINDTDGVYNMVKDFVSQYNNILKEVNELYYAGSARGYDVLSDEERDAMTEEQIEKWENKIKGSLLRNDSTLYGVRSALTSIANTSVMVDGKSYSLTSFGIGTSDYTEKGLLHIDGDSSDSATSSNADKLLSAITEDPDLVMQVFTELGSKLYSSLTDKMSSTSLSSAMKFYNDKQITSQKKDYDTEIEKWEKKLSDMEDRYYSQFAAMETALSKLNAQTSYITSMFSV